MKYNLSSLLVLLTAKAFSNVVSLQVSCLTIRKVKAPASIRRFRCRSSVGGTSGFMLKDISGHCGNESMKLQDDIYEQAIKDQLQTIVEVSQDAENRMKEIVSGTTSLMEDEQDLMSEKSVAETNWTGQSTAEVIRVSQRNWSDLMARRGLATVDILALFTFAVVGRSSHNEHSNLLLDLQTAAPFIASWCMLSPLIGAYTRESTASLGEIPIRLLPSWVISIPTALVMRGLSRGAVPPTPFIVVSMISTFVALWLFRSLYVLVAGDTSDAEQRSAGPLDIFSMINTLLKRW